MSKPDFLTFVGVEDDPNLEVIEFEPGERYLLRNMDPDSPTEQWTYHRKGESARIVYHGGILPSSMVPKMIILTMEGWELPFPESEAISNRLKG